VLCLKLERDFYNRKTLIVARQLLGKTLVHNKDGIITSGKIVEVEAYLGMIDKAAHTYNGKRTARVEHMYGMPGVAYVYFIYGMYYCFNVVTRETGIAEAVLVRAIEPVIGIDEMSIRRYKMHSCEIDNKKLLNLTSGPSKLCSALSINKDDNGKDLCGDSLYIEDGIDNNFEIEISKRIGIDYSEEAAEFPWRFFIKGNPYVSR
jgi:DNA-3-methyladenine glycosylase